MPLASAARGAIGRYDGMVSAIPNAQVLLAPLITQEAVLSSMIEGTSATVSEVLALEAGASQKGFSQSKRDDAEEIKNYCKALDFASDALSREPFSLDLLCQAHKRLMDGVRGRDKSPGSFRERQNWIGHPGHGIERARYVPIAQEYLMKGVKAWHRYALSEDAPDPLMQLAVIHVEFEALHPFRDGNGRLGRMLIPLLLFGKGLLTSPNFYFSAYLEARREEYFAALRAVSRDDAWTEWCAFFLKGIYEQANDNQEKTLLILDRHKKMSRDIAKLTRSPHSALAVDFLFSKPIFSARQFMGETGISESAARRMLSLLTEPGILTASRGDYATSPIVYSFPTLLDIIEG